MLNQRYLHITAIGSIDINTLKKTKNNYLPLLLTAVYVKNTYCCTFVSNKNVIEHPRLKLEMEHTL